MCEFINNQIYYLHIDTIGLHRVENPSHTDGAVSLHLYCPPFDTCSIFDKQTGKRTLCKTTFWSKFGERKSKVNTHFKIKTFSTGQTFI